MTQQTRDPHYALPTSDGYPRKVKELYDVLDHNDDYERTWGYGNPIAGPYFRHRDADVLGNVTEHFKCSMNSLKVLEVGVGHGHELAKFAQLGIPHSNLTGIDLLPQRLAWARTVYPAITFLEQDATQLSFPDGTFDIVCQFGCFVHLPSREMQRLACLEMVRVLKPGGIIIWWDLAPIRWSVVLCRRWANLRTASWSRKLRVLVSSVVRSAYEAVVARGRRRSCRAGLPENFLPLGREDVVAMFPGLNVKVRAIGTDYEVWRVNWPRSRAVANLFWYRGWLSVHCFATITKEISA